MVTMTVHQRHVVAEALAAFSEPSHHSSCLGVLLVGSPGVGLSTCVEQIKSVTDRKCIELKSVDFHSRVSLGVHLGRILGLCNVKTSMKKKVSLPLVSLIKIIGVTLFVLEDAHDLETPEACAEIIKEFAKLKGRVPEVKLLMTIHIKEMVGAFFLESSLSKFFSLITVKPMAKNDLELFLVGRIKPTIDSYPMCDRRLLDSIHEYSQGSIGRAILVADLLRHILNCTKEEERSADEMIRVITTINW